VRPGALPAPDGVGLINGSTVIRSAVRAPCRCMLRRGWDMSSFPQTPFFAGVRLLLRGARDEFSLTNPITSSIELVPVLIMFGEPVEVLLRLPFLPTNRILTDHEEVRCMEHPDTPAVRTVVEQFYRWRLIEIFQHMCAGRGSIVARDWRRLQARKQSAGAIIFKRACRSSSPRRSASTKAARANRSSGHRNGAPESLRRPTQAEYSKRRGARRIRRPGVASGYYVRHG
jgi:hypothetical protein